VATFLFSHVQLLIGSQALLNNTTWSKTFSARSKRYGRLTVHF